MALLKESTFSGSNGSHFKLRLEYSYTQSTSDNQTTITYTEKMVSQDGWSGSGATNSLTGYIGGTSSSDIVGRASSIGVNSTITLGSRSYTITHNADGTFPNTSYFARIDCGWNNVNRAEVSGTLTSSNIPRINRVATILSAEDFNDEGNPTITFSNPSNYTIKPYITFYDNNGTLVYSLYRDIEATSPYTWDITNEERTALRNATNQQPTYNAWLGVDTFNGSTKLGANSMGKTFTIINADPTAAITITEQNANVVTLLGSATSDKVVNQVSSLLFGITPTALKGATISSVKINGVNATESSGVYSLQASNITNGTFNVVVTDSRTLVTTYTISKTLLDYVSLSINSWSVERASSVSSDLVLNADITCFSGTIDGTTNTPTVQYSIDGTNWTTISSSSYTFTNNKITITNLTLPNVIVYTSYGTFYLKITDLLTSANDNKQISKGVETFSYGENDVQINGDLFIADTDGNNAINVMDLINNKGRTKITFDRTSAWTTSSTTDTDLPNASTTLTTYGGDILVNISMDLQVTGNMLFISVIVDGTNKGEIFKMDAGAGRQYINGQLLITGIASGSHTIKLQIHVQNSNNVATIYGYNTQQMTILEL